MSADAPGHPTAPEADASGNTPWRLTVWWIAAWLLTAALLAATRYGSGDPDSSLYAGISARIATLPIRQWIAPEWWGFWQITGPYYEHPVGMFVVPAALARLGYPAPQAAYAVNALYQAASFLLVVLLARSVLPRREADALGWIVQLLPIAFVFRIRANQEYAVLAGLLLALYACERARTRPPWAAGMIAGFLAVLLVKGVFAFMVPLLCVLWLLARGGVSVGRPGPSEPAAAGRAVAPRADVRRARIPLAAWAGILMMPVAGALTTWAYEMTYVEVTGRSFLDLYRARQVPEGALTSGSPVVRTAYHLVWYTGRVIWYAFPWSLLAGAAVWGALRARAFDPRGSGAGPGSGGVRAEDARRAGLFAAAATFALVIGFSLAHRKADRYIFPAYFSAAALGGGYALARFPGLSRLAAAVDRPYVPPALQVGLVLLRLATRGALPEFTFWRS